MGYGYSEVVAILNAIEEGRISFPVSVNEEEKNNIFKKVDDLSAQLEDGSLGDSLISELSNFLRTVVKSGGVCQQEDKTPLVVTPAKLLDWITANQDSFQNEMQPHLEKIARIAAENEKKKVQAEEHLKSQQNIKEYLNEIEIKKFINNVQASVAVQDVHVVAYELICLAQYLQHKINIAPSIRAQIITTYKSIIDDLAKQKSFSPEMTGVFRSLVDSLDKRTIYGKVAMLLPNHRAITESHLESDTAIIRHLTHTQPIEQVLPKINDLYPEATEKAANTRIKQKLYIYELEHPVEIMHVQVAMLEKNSDATKADKLAYQGMICQQFLKHLETLILETPWKTRLTGKKVYDEHGNYINTVSPTMYKMLKEIQKGKEKILGVSNEEEAKIWIDVFNTVAHMGNEAAINEPKFLGIKTRSEQVQHFFDHIKEAYTNRDLFEGKLKKDQKEEESEGEKPPSKPQI